MAKFTGICKVKLRDETYLVRITDGDMELDPLTEGEYRLSTIKPDFEDLTEGDWLPPGYGEG